MDQSAEKKIKKQTEKQPKKGISLARTNLILAIASVIISVVLLFTTFLVNNTHRRLETISNEHIEWQQVAIDMEFASNYLTEEARTFVESGKRENMDNYFKEAKVTRRRENALEKIREHFSEDSAVYQALKAALEESVSLMDAEYFAMRLRLSATNEDKGDKILQYPEEIQNVDLGNYANIKDWKEKLDIAHEKVNGFAYRDQKDRIENNVNDCLNHLIDETSAEQDEVTRQMTFILIMQRIWIILLIAVMLAMIIAVMHQIIQPLRRAVPSIRNDEPIPISGAAEFRLLARTYNRMYEINQEYREKLLFKANHDALTGVLNRAGIKEMLKGADLSQAALLIVDVDHFKSVNDRFGHEMGDVVLSAVAKTLQELFRIEDVICRMGGDEFAIIMWHMRPDKKELIVDKTKRANEILSRGEDGMPPISVSVGVAFGTEENQDELFHNADRALYAAKEAGRSRCAFFGEDAD